MNCRNSVNVKKLDYDKFEPRRMLASDFEIDATSSESYTHLESVEEFGAGVNLQWVDAAGNAIGDNDIPNRTEITARLITNQNLPDIVNASIYEDDILFDDFIIDIPLTKINANTWAGTWQSTWSDDGAGLPEYYFQVDGVSGSSNSIDVLQGNGWHVQSAAAGTLEITSEIDVTFQAPEIPAGVHLSQLAIEVDFGSVSFAQSQHEFGLVLSGPNSELSESFVIDQNFNFDEAVVEVFRSAGCDTACPGSDFSSQFLSAGLTGGFYGNWTLSANNLDSGDSIQVTSFRTTLTFFSRLNLSGYDSQLGPDDPIPKSDRDYGFVSDFNNNELSPNPIVTNATILIHGWNPGIDGLGFSYAEHYGGQFWQPLEQVISSYVGETTNWLVGQYDWVNDAATGSAGPTDIIATLASAPLSSRDVGTAHGAYLGRALFGATESLFTQLDAVQFIAHSAGNWVAVEAAAYLRDIGFTGDIQLTSLDPFVPDVGSAFGITAGVETERIFEAAADSFAGSFNDLENYYVDDTESDIFFGWTSGNYSTWKINRQLDAGPTPLFTGNFDSHSGPIGWYAETAEFLLAGGDPTTLEENGTTIGFGNSLLFHDWQLANAAEVPAVALEVINGSIINGSLSDLANSDNQRISLIPSKTIAPSESPVFLELTGILANSSPDVLGFRLETSTNTPNIVQSLQFFNYVTNSFENLSSDATTLADSSLSVQVQGTTSNYIGENGEVRTRVGFAPDGPVLLFPWTIHIDQAVWLTNPGAVDAFSVTPTHILHEPNEKTSETNWQIQPLAAPAFKFYDVQPANNFIAEVDEFFAKVVKIDEANGIEISAPDIDAILTDLLNDLGSPFNHFVMI